MNGWRETEEIIIDDRMTREARGTAPGLSRVSIADRGPAHETTIPSHVSPSCPSGERGA